MRTFSAAQQQTASAQSSAVLLKRQCTCGKCAHQGAERESSDCDGARQQAARPVSAVSAFDYDFGRIPVYAKASAQAQPKLAVSTPGDVHERHAGEMADSVIRMPGADSSGHGLGHSPSSSHGGGNLDRETRSFMQRRFGADFGSVRIHADDRAARMRDGRDPRP